MGENNSIVESFRAGGIKCCLDKWKSITSDPFILAMVQGCTIELEEIPKQHFVPKPYSLSIAERQAASLEIQKLLSKGVIEKTSTIMGDFFSNIFLVPKKNGSYRLILNLKKFNSFVVKHHFKMDTLVSVVQLMTPNCYMASIDLRDAYYSVPIIEDDRKYLKFVWDNETYQFTCLPNGLSCSPRLFTKILKPVYANLHSKGHISVGYIDDSYLQGNTIEACQKNIDDTVELFKSLGFIVHPEKSVLTPSQQLIFLGFILDSVSMRVSPTPEKAANIKASCMTLVRKSFICIRELAETVGKLVASFPGVQFGPLFYRTLDNEKIAALRRHCGNYEAKISLSSTAKADLDWWCNNIESAYKPVIITKPDLEFETDASHLGWGAVYNNIQTGGRWTPMEAQQHINFLEMKAVFLALKTFCLDITKKHIKVHIDNTTAVAYINAMGGSKSSSCCQMARQIWLFCIERKIWLTAVHLPGILNIEADHASRVFNDRTEWMLRHSMFIYVTSKLSLQPTIDLFASRLNYQLKPFISWRPDPEAFAVDAFTIDWGTHIFYAFPPFSLLGRVLQKVQQDQAEGIIIVPYWQTQVWYPKLLQLMIKEPVQIPQTAKNLYLPFNPDKVHPLANKLKLLACHVSGKVMR